LPHDFRHRVAARRRSDRRASGPAAGSGRRRDRTQPRVRAATRRDEGTGGDDRCRDPPPRSRERRGEQAGRRGPTPHRARSRRDDRAVVPPRARPDPRDPRDGPRYNHAAIDGRPRRSPPRSGRSPRGTAGHPGGGRAGARGASRPRSRGPGRRAGCGALPLARACACVDAPGEPLAAVRRHAALDDGIDPHPRDRLQRAPARRCRSRPPQAGRSSSPARPIRRRGSSPRRWPGIPGAWPLAPVGSGTRRS
jgi:hypothetical protein